MKPRFQSLEKKKGREWVAQVFREKTGAPCLSSGHQFWELCSDQTEPDSSFHEFTSMVLFTPSQYRGVDRELQIVRTNENKFGPSVKFIHGDWKAVIHQAFIEDEFKPQLIYLDTEVMSALAAALTAYTMRRCPVGAVLVVNTVTQNLYKGRTRSDPNRDDRKVFMDELGKVMSPIALQGWDKQVPTFPYKGYMGIHMLQFALYKEPC